MGLSDSTLKSLTKPCTTCCHDLSKYCLDDFELDSGCSECCNIHLRTHAHKDSDNESENAAPENEAA